MRKTEYISTEYNRFTPLANKAEARVGFNIKKYFKEEDIYKDRESQLQAIESTFEAVKAPVISPYHLYFSDEILWPFLHEAPPPRSLMFLTLWHTYGNVAKELHGA